MRKFQRIQYKLHSLYTNPFKVHVWSHLCGEALTFHSLPCSPPFPSPSLFPLSSRISFPSLTSPFPLPSIPLSLSPLSLFPSSFLSYPSHSSFFPLQSHLQEELAQLLKNDTHAQMELLTQKNNLLQDENKSLKEENEKLRLEIESLRTMLAKHADSQHVNSQPDSS